MTTKANAGTGTARVVLSKPRKGTKREGYYLLVKEVDRAKKNAYALVGEFLKSGYELDLPVGAVVVRRTPAGSHRNPQDIFEHARVPPDGENWQWSEPHTRRTFLSFRDEVARVLDETRTGNPEGPETERARPRPPRSPEEMTPERQSGWAGQILTAAQFYGRLDHLAGGPGRLAYDQQTQRFTKNEGPNPSPQSEAILEEINLFLRNVLERCPKYLSGRMGFDGGHLTIRASQHDMFRAIHGVDLEQIRELLENAAPPEEISNPRMLSLLQDAVRQAPAETGAFREETWRTVEQNLKGLGFGLEDTPFPDTKKLADRDPGSEPGVFGRPRRPLSRPFPPARESTSSSRYCRAIPAQAGIHRPSPRESPHNAEPR